MNEAQHGDPTIAPGGEDERPRVLASAQSGSLLDLEARELLGRMRFDMTLDPAIRRRAEQALQGNGTLQDVMFSPEFLPLLERAKADFERQVAEMTPEQHEEMRARFRDISAGPFGIRRPTMEDE